MTAVAVMAALICVAGPLTISIGPIPLSLATFAIYLAGAVLGRKWGTLAVGVYLLIGTLGLPVFSGFSGGLQKLVGVSGGYLIGYLPCALITGVVVPKDRTPGKGWLFFAMTLGTLALYAIGTAWFMFLTKNTLSASIGLCVLPFLAGDAIKITAATLITPPLRRAIYQ